MTKLSNVFVIASKLASVLELTAYAAKYGERVSLLVAGERDLAVNAERAYYFGSLDDTSFISYIPGMVRLISEQKPELVLVELSRNGRLAAAHIAAALGTSVLTDCTDFRIEDGKAYASRMVYGGGGLKTECAQWPVVACLSMGGQEAAGVSAASEVIDIKADIGDGVTMTGKTCKTVQAVNLNAASKVVGVGRGFSTEESLSLARDLASLIGAEVACTRPIAEEEKWLPTERYIGVSGAMIKPGLYIAAGISGQIQHMVGVNKSNTIIAINKDEHAPIFENCDYGIVGDLMTVIPDIISKLKG